MRHRYFRQTHAVVLATTVALMTCNIAPSLAEQNFESSPESKTELDHRVQATPQADAAHETQSAQASSERRAQSVPAQASSSERRAQSTPAQTAPAQSADAKKAPQMLKGSVDYVVPQGTAFKLKLASVPTTGMHLFDRDLDGNLYPAELGQEVTAKTTEDMYIDDNKVIPEGTVFHGKVSKIEAPKRLHRDGSLSISFDYLKTPDGKLFAFKADANNFVKSTTKSKAREAGRVAAHAAGGAIVGALVAYQIFGWKQTLAMHGYNIAGGAAGGALIATGFALADKGKKAILEPGDNLNMQINTDLLMPAAVEPTIKASSQNLEGLDVQVEKSKLVKDGLDGHIVRLDVLIANNSEKELKSIDLYLEDGNGNRSPICNGVDIDFDNTEFLFSVKPHTRRKVRLNFAVEFPKLNRQLVWLDHKSRQVCYRQQLP